MPDMAGRAKTALFLPYGNRSKITRRMITTFISSSLVERTQLIEIETYKYILRLSGSPENLFAHLKRYAVFDLSLS